MDEPLEHAYFNWLYSKVNPIAAKSKRQQFNTLFNILHRTEFIFLISGDDNRAEDGRDLRLEFFREEAVPQDAMFSSEGCSMLEMLIGFSRVASFETDDSPNYWFWHMLSNIGLSGLNDPSLKNISAVHEAIDRVVWRTYDSRGNGSLFPMHHTNKDQRKVELWYQFNEYLFELDNY